MLVLQLGSENQDAAKSQNEKQLKSRGSVFILREVSPHKFEVHKHSPGTAKAVIEKIEWLGASRPTEYLRRWAAETALYNWIR